MLTNCGRAARARGFSRLLRRISYRGDAYSHSFDRLICARYSRERCHSSRILFKFSSSVYHSGTHAHNSRMLKVYLVTLCGIPRALVRRSHKDFNSKIFDFADLFCIDFSAVFQWFTKAFRCAFSGYNYLGRIARASSEQSNSLICSSLYLRVRYPEALTMLLAECPLTLPSPEGEGLQVTPVPLQGGTNLMARKENL